MPTLLVPAGTGTSCVEPAATVAGAVTVVPCGSSVRRYEEGVPSYQVDPGAVNVSLAALFFHCALRIAPGGRVTAS